MKLSVLLATLLVSQASAFTAAPLTQRSSTTLTTSSSLSLFGGGGGEKKGPGMMDQLAMLKKAQDMAQKKKAIDDELQKMTFEGVSENGKVKGSFKFVPISSPMDPNPDYDAVSFEFDDEFFESADPSEIAAEVKSAVESGMRATNEAVGEKYAVLQSDLMAAFGGAEPKKE